jgi:transcriptional regulator GlxA family with amidase domain
MSAFISHKIMNRKNFIKKTLVAGAYLGFTGSSFSKESISKSPVITSDDKLIHVACAISDGTTDIDWVGPCAAFETWHRDEQNRPAPKFKIYTVSEKREPVGGWIADYTFDDVPQPKIIIVPAQSGSVALHDWLRKMNANAEVEIIMSVCVGARHLAKAGLLDGMTATTHHEAVDKLAKDYPNVKWVKGVRFVEGPKICTAGGLTSGIDLGLRIIERYLGRKEALMVAEHLEYESRKWIVD